MVNQLPTLNAGGRYKINVSDAFNVQKFNDKKDLKLKVGEGENKTTEIMKHRKDNDNEYSI
jgi:hypothetical protein